MQRFPRALTLAGIALLLGAAAPATTLTFDELPFQPVDGLSFSGVTFGFEVGGAPSPDASYNSSGPGLLTLVQDPVLEGDAAGILTLDFAVSTCDLSFGLALGTFGPVTPGAVVNLYDGAGILLGSEAVDLDSIVSFSEGLFSWVGPIPAARAVIDFDENAASRFALDNLTFHTVPCIPEAGTVLSGLGLVAMAGVAWRRQHRR